MQMSVLHFIVSFWSEIIWQHCYNILYHEERRAGANASGFQFTKRGTAPQSRIHARGMRLWAKCCGAASKWKLSQRWMMPVRVVSRKIKANCFLCATGKRPWAKLTLTRWVNMAVPMPGCFLQHKKKSEERTGIRHSQRDMYRREQPRQHGLSLKRFFASCFYTMSTHFFFF